jgi:hypothetical protein
MTIRKEKETVKEKNRAKGKETGGIFLKYLLKLGLLCFVTAEDGVTASTKEYQKTKKPVLTINENRLKKIPGVVLLSHPAPAGCPGRSIGAEGLN